MHVILAGGDGRCWGVIFSDNWKNNREAFIYSTGIYSVEAVDKSLKRRNRISVKIQGVANSKGVMHDAKAY